MAWNSALLYDMIYTQPVVYEFNELKMPVLLMIGTKDNTAIGKDLVPPEIRKTLGNYAVLGKETAKRIPHATLVEFNDMGHAPQMQDPERFHEALLKGFRPADWFAATARAATPARDCGAFCRAAMLLVKPGTELASRR